LTEDRSVEAKEGCSSIATSMVGTPTIALPDDRVANSSSTRPGSNASSSTIVAAFDTAPITQQTQPPVWNSGIGMMNTSPARPHPLGGVGAVIGEAAMVQQRALRKTRGARGVLDHHRIGGFDDGKRDALIVAGGDEGSPVVEADDLAKFGAVRRDLAHRLQHRIAAEAVDDEHSGRARLLQHIFDFLAPEAGIDGDQHHAASPAPNSSMIHSGSSAPTPRPARPA